MKKTKTQKIFSRIGKELKKNPPKILKHTAKKYGKADAKAQKTAILMNKARKAGAKIRPYNAGAYESARRSHYKLGRKVG